MRVVGALMIVAVTALARPATAKLCPYGRFTVTPEGSAADAMVLRLDADGVTLEGECAAGSMRPGPYPYGVPIRMRARWKTPCGSQRFVAMRAQFRPPCDTLTGVLRHRRGAKTRFTALRVPVCGDGYVSTGETCDDANTVGGDCCAADCQAEPGCFIACERTAECNPIALCVRQPGMCGGSGACWPPALAAGFSQHPCGDGPVCGCEGRTYASSCEAWAVGVNVLRPGACG